MWFPIVVVAGFLWLLLLFWEIRQDVKSLSMKLERLEKALVNLKAKQD
jgi:hypothetical protein